MSKDIHVLQQQHYYLQAYKQLPLQEGPEFDAIKQNEHAYRETLVQSILASIENEEWFKGRYALAFADDHLTPHHKIKAAKTKFEAAFNEQNRRIQTRLALSEAQLLLAKAAELEFNESSSNSEFQITFRKNHLELERSHLMDTLMALSAKAVEAQDYQGAEHTFHMANSLNNQSYINELSNRNESDVHLESQNIINQRLKLLIVQLDNASLKKQFERMDKLISILQREPFKSELARKAITKANAIISKEANTLDKKADDLYQDGKVSEAIDSWETAYQLSPKIAGLKDKLTRAKKVQKKLETLRGG